MSLRESRILHGRRSQYPATFARGTPANISPTSFTSSAPARRRPGVSVPPGGTLSEHLFRDPPRLDELLPDPPVGPGQTLFQGDLGFPPQHPPEPGVVAVSPADTLGLRRVIPLHHPLPRDPGDDIHQLVDRHHPVRSQVDRLRSEEHTSELQSLTNLVCRLLLEKKKNMPDRH